MISLHVPRFQGAPDFGSERPRHSSGRAMVVWSAESSSRSQSGSDPRSEESLSGFSQRNLGTETSKDWISCSCQTDGAMGRGYGLGCHEWYSHCCSHFGRNRKHLPQQWRRFNWRRASHGLDPQSRSENGVRRGRISVPDAGYEHLPATSARPSYFLCAYGYRSIHCLRPSRRIEFASSPPIETG